MAREYGWTIDHIYGLTSREVSFMISNISKRRRHEANLIEIQRGFEASLHGAKYYPQIQLDGEPKNIAEFSKEQDDIIGKHLEQRMAEMKQQANQQGS